MTTLDVGDWHLFDRFRDHPAPCFRGFRRRDVPRDGFLHDVVLLAASELPREERLLRPVASSSQRHVPAIVEVVVDGARAAIVREGAAGPSVADVLAALRAQRSGACVDPSTAFTIAAAVADACDAGKDVPAVVSPATMSIGWDGHVRLCGFGRTPVARGALHEEQYVPWNAPPDWRRRTGALGSYAIAHVLYEMLTGRTAHVDRRGRFPSSNNVDADVVINAGRALAAPAELSSLLRASLAPMPVVGVAHLAAAMRALFPDAWRTERALRDRLGIP